MRVSEGLICPRKANAELQSQGGVADHSPRIIHAHRLAEPSGKHFAVGGQALNSNSMPSGPGYPAYLVVDTNPDAVVEAEFESGQLRA